jgi:hypothetical protein
MLRPHDARASWGGAISGVLDIDHDRSREQRVLGWGERATSHGHERAGAADRGADATDADERGASRCADATADDEPTASVPRFRGARAR